MRRRTCFTRLVLVTLPMISMQWLRYGVGCSVQKYSFNSKYCLLSVYLCSNRIRMFADTVQSLFKFYKCWYFKIRDRSYRNTLGSSIELDQVPCPVSSFSSPLGCCSDSWAYFTTWGSMSLQKGIVSNVRLFRNTYLVYINLHSEEKHECWMRYMSKNWMTPLMFG